MSISNDVTMAGGQFKDLTERVSHHGLEDTDENKQLEEEEDLQGSADQDATGHRLPMPSQAGSISMPS